MGSPNTRTPEVVTKTASEQFSSGIPSSMTHDLVNALQKSYGTEQVRIFGTSLQCRVRPESSGESCQTSTGSCQESCQTSTGSYQESCRGSCQGSYQSSNIHAQEE